MKSLFFIFGILLTFSITHAQAQIIIDENGVYDARSGAPLPGYNAPPAARQPQQLQAPAPIPAPQNLQRPLQIKRIFAQPMMKEQQPVPASPMPVIEPINKETYREKALQMLNKQQQIDAQFELGYQEPTLAPKPQPTPVTNTVVDVPTQKPEFVRPSLPAMPEKVAKPVEPILKDFQPPLPERTDVSKMITDAPEPPALPATPSDADTLAIDEEIIVEEEITVAPVIAAQPMPPKNLDQQEFELRYRLGTTNLADVASEESMLRIIQIMQDNKSLHIDVFSHAKNRSAEENNARRLSLNRALNLRTRFMDSGITSDRINIRAMGDENGPETLDKISAIIYRKDNSE